VQKPQCKKGTLIQNLTQPLHLVQQYIALFPYCFVLRYLETWTGGPDEVMHFVDGGVEAPCGDEAREFAGWGVRRVEVTVKKFRWGKEKEENKERGCSPVYFRFFSWSERRRDKDTQKANKGNRIERRHG
jgi:hypothetical protein